MNHVTLYLGGIEHQLAVKDQKLQKDSDAIEGDQHQLITIWVSNLSK